MIWLRKGVATALATFVTVMTIGTLQSSAQPMIPDDPTSGGSPDGRIMLDGVAAVVGDQIILISDVVQQAALMSSRSGGYPQIPGPGVLQEVLDDLVTSKILYVKAIEDSIEVPEDLLNSQVDEYIARAVANAGSEATLEQAAGKSITELRADVRPMVREQLMVEILRRRRASSQSVTTREIEEFYRLYRDSLPRVPEQIELAHIYIQAETGEEARERARELAQRIADSIRDGGVFGEFARRYSIDPGSASKGGELGWVAHGKFVSEFEDAVEELGINEISDPVESKFGFHIIQLLDEEEGRFRSRHILLPIEASEQELAAIRDTLEMLRRRLRDGESFAELAEQYSDDVDSRVRGGILERFPTSELGPYRWVVDSLDVGEVAPPRPFQISPTESGYHILKLVRIIPPHAFDPVEDRDRLEPLVARHRQSRELLAWIDELREDIYWEIMHDFTEN